MKQMFVVMKETYIRQVKSWVSSSWSSVPSSFRIEHWNRLSDRFFYRCKNQVALVTEVPAVKESLKGTDGLTLDYKDEAAAKKKLSRMREAAAYLTVDEKDGQLEATYVGDQAMKTDLKTLVACEIKPVQQGINMARANLNKRATDGLVSTGFSEKKNWREKRRLENGANHGCRWFENVALYDFDLLL